MIEEKIPVDALYATNAYVAVTLIGRKADGTPDFRQGFLSLNVKADALKPPALDRPEKLKSDARGLVMEDNQNIVFREEIPASANSAPPPGEVENFVNAAGVVEGAAPPPPRGGGAAPARG